MIVSRSEDVRRFDVAVEDIPNRRASLSSWLVIEELSLWPVWWAMTRVVVRAESLSVELNKSSGLIRYQPP